MPRYKIQHLRADVAARVARPLRAALYVRVSTIEQAENQLSIQEQEAQLRHWMGSKGYEFAGLYQDLGKSGSNLQRPAFQKLLRAVEQTSPPFDLILVHSLSRAFRDLTDQEITFKKLQASGIKLLSMSEQLGDDAQSPMMRKLIGFANEIKSNDARIGTMRGMKATAKAGYSNGARAPLGYRPVDAEKIGNKVKRRYEVDPVEAEIIRLIFKLAQHGNGIKGPMGVKAISDELNGQGYRTREGNLFGTGSVHEILIREDYTGAKPWNVRSKNGRFNELDEIVTIAIPQIITPETFDTVQQRLMSRLPQRRGPRLDSTPSLLGGLIRCRHCGGAATPSNGTSRSGQIYEYYKCVKRIKVGKYACTGISIPRPLVETKVMDGLLEKLVTPDRLFTILNEINQRQVQRKSSELSRIAALDREAADTEAALNNLYGLIEKGIVQPQEITLRARLSDLTEKRDVALEARKRARAKLSEPIDLDAAKLDQFAKALKKGLTEGDVSARKAWITSVVDVIVVDDTTIRVIGQKSNLNGPLKSGGPTPKGVHSSVQSWCRK
jgi:site-specific DNA recombinase